LFAWRPVGNKSHGARVIVHEAVTGNNGYAGATEREALSAFAQVSDHGSPLPHQQLVSK